MQIWYFCFDPEFIDIRHLFDLEPSYIVKKARSNFSNCLCMYIASMFILQNLRLFDLHSSFAKAFEIKLVISDCKESGCQLNENLHLLRCPWN